jgi:hypothetical protein
MNHSVKREKAQRERERAMKGRGGKGEYCTSFIHKSEV